MSTCRKLYLTLFAAGFILQTACQTTPATTSAVEVFATTAAPTVNPGLLKLGPPATREALFDLTAAQRELFLDAYHYELAHLRPHLRLAHYLQHLTANYNYRERTLTASEAFAGIPGNCISLVVLTTALAQLVDLDIDYQRLATEPIFDKQEGLVLVSDHLRTRVFAPSKNNPRNRRPYVIIDYFPAQGSRDAEYIDLSTLLAMYYSNRAAESILDGQLTAAAQFAEFALEHVPTYANAYNLLAILHRRIQDDTSAEAFFRFALQHRPDELNVLNNYHLLLTEQDRTEEASIISQRIAELNDTNPYQLIALADFAFQHGDYRNALHYYQQAAAIAPYLHEAYLHQAVVLQRMGLNRQAAAKIEEGLVQAQLSATEAHYKRRLSAFKSSGQVH